MRKKKSDRTKERVHRLGLDLGKREKQVACHVSSLALTMTDEACR